MLRDILKIIYHSPICRVREGKVLITKCDCFAKDEADQLLALFNSNLKEEREENKRLKLRICHKHGEYNCWDKYGERVSKATNTLEVKEEGKS